MMEKIDLDRLQQSNECSKQELKDLLDYVGMLEKQKSFLQRKLREKYEKTKDPTL